MGESFLGVIYIQGAEVFCSQHLGQWEGLEKVLPSWVLYHIHSVLGNVPMSLGCPWVGDGRMPVSKTKRWVSLSLPLSLLILIWVFLPLPLLSLLYCFGSPCLGLPLGLEGCRQMLHDGSNAGSSLPDSHLMIV